MTTHPITASHSGLVGCHACDYVTSNELLKKSDHAHCPRCGSTLHQRIPDSIDRTWALLIASLILYIPANVFPIMTVVSFGRGEADTIMSGVIVLFQSNQAAIALLVFFASIFVPVLKIVGLAFLLISVQTKSTWRPVERTKIYRIIEVIGRWSMIDIFMISILIALVQLQAIATIDVGPAAVAFAAVVVLTMFASMSFDPRLIWDNLGPQPEAQHG